MQPVQTVSDVLGAKKKVMVVFLRNIHNQMKTDGDTTKPAQEDMISKIADNWNETQQMYPEELAQTTSFTDPLSENCSLLFSEEVLGFCSKNNVFHECCKYYGLFQETFKHIQNIDILISEDPEIPDYRQISFILTVADSIEHVLQYEDIFREKLRNCVEKEKRQYFVYNYILI